MGQSEAFNLNNNQIQVLLTGKLGDGCLTIPKSSTTQSHYSTNCIHKEYLEFKQTLLGWLTNKIGYREHNGYSQKPIYTLSSSPHPFITYLRNLSIEETLKYINDLGIALWFYDDGSLHKNKLFYNLNTQAFSREINEDVFVPFFKSYGITAKTTIERKKDGREFWYLRISKYEGAYEISQILSKYKIDCYNYKIWSSETIQNWSKMQEHLIRENMVNCSNKMKSIILKKIEQGII